MSNNGPVTNVGRHYGEHERIVSKTDTKGRLTYFNPTNASLVEEAAQASHAMEDESGGLIKMMDFFRLTGMPPATRGQAVTVTAAAPRRDTRPDAMPAAAMARKRPPGSGRSNRARF
jgi:hypothetical protein